MMSVSVGRPELVCDIVGKADGLAAFGALHEFADGCARILGHALDHGVGFRVHGAGVEGLLAVPDAQEAGATAQRPWGRGGAP